MRKPIILTLCFHMKSPKPCIRELSDENLHVSEGSEKLAQARG